MTPRNRLVYPCAAIAALLICGAVGSMDYADALLAEAEYCANVRDWNASGGEFGHPDYDGIADAACNFSPERSRSTAGRGPLQPRPATYSDEVMK